jgi:hypothetical protein
VNPPIHITPGSWWIYRGQGEGYGGSHCITSAANDCITTWSIPQNAGGFSWLGTHAEFDRDFIPA